MCDTILLLLIYLGFIGLFSAIAFVLMIAAEWILNLFGKTLVPDDGDWEDDSGDPER